MAEDSAAGSAATSRSNLTSDRNGVGAIVINYQGRRLEKEGSSNELVQLWSFRVYGYISALDLQQVNTPMLPVERSSQLGALLIHPPNMPVYHNTGGKGIRWFEGLSITKSQTRGLMLFHLPRITEVHV